MPEIDRFFMQHALGDHVQRNQVPELPEGFPFLSTGNARPGIGGRGGGSLRQSIVFQSRLDLFGDLRHKGEIECRFLQQPETVFAFRVFPELYDTQSRMLEHFEHFRNRVLEEVAVSSVYGRGILALNGTDLAAPFHIKQLPGCNADSLQSSFVILPCNRLILLAFVIGLVSSCRTLRVKRNVSGPRTGSTYLAEYRTCSCTPMHPGRCLPKSIGRPVHSHLSIPDPPLPVHA